MDVCNKSGNDPHSENVEEGDGVILAAEGWIMCIVCERELWGEHRALESEFFKPCKTCKKFPGASSEGTCYHCYAVGNTIDECPACTGKTWSEEFLEAKDEIEGPDQLVVPY
jgi:hypothetical protein